MKREMILALALLGFIAVAEENPSRKEDFKPVKLGELDISSAFKDYLAGSPKSVWKKIGWSNKPEGIIEIREGKLFMQSKGAPFTGLWMQLPAANSFFVKPGEKIRITVTAQGSGLFGYWAYGADKKFLGKQCTGKKVSCKEMKKYSAVFTVGEGVAKITPFITAAKDGITVESLQIEIVHGTK